MSKRQPAFTSPVPGAEVRRTAPALYWILYESARPRSCAVCPFGTMVQIDASDPLAGTAVCKLGKYPFFVQVATSPDCHDGNWQWRSREELGELWQRLMATDAELAEIAAELGAPAPAEIVAQANEAARAKAQQRRTPQRARRKPQS